MYQDSQGYYHIRGCIHLHTLDSDGTKTHEEIAEIAHSAGLDFLMFTDHMTLKSRRAKEGIHSDVVCIIGYEHNDPADKHHYLLFDTPGVYDASLTAAEYVSAGAKDGAIGIIAHPDEIRAESGEWPPYEWRNWDVEGFTGIELWNHMSEWMEALAPASFPARVGLLFSPRKFLIRPPARTMDRWDKLNERRQVVGVAGPDAHGFPYRLGPKKLTIFPYKVHFRTLQTHLLLDKPLAPEFSTARRQILEALRSARVYFSNNRRGDAEGFEFVCRADESADTEPLISGANNIVFRAGLTLQVSTPGKCEIRLLRNGEIIAGASGSTLEFAVDSPGAYRVEALRRGRGWIYSNHIRIGL